MSQTHTFDQNQKTQENKELTSISRGTRVWRLKPVSAQAYGGVAHPHKTSSALKPQS